MGLRRGVTTTAVVTLLLVGGVTSAACKKSPSEEEEQATATAPTVAKSTETPLDHLAPGELAPGKETALGFTLPRGMRVERVIPGSAAYARGQVGPAALAGYVRGQVHGGSEQALPFEGTLFEHVTLSDPKVQLSFRIEQDPEGARLEIHDVTPPPQQQLPDDEARWRAAGLKPNGQPLDPTHLQ